MKLQLFVSLAATFGGTFRVQCFQQQKSLATTVAPSKPKISIVFAKDRDDFIPETSFGAEVVPEEQRPVNEYLEMRRSPLFEWASNEVGTKGVSCDAVRLPREFSWTTAESYRPFLLACWILWLCVRSF
jgi:hypothetical protein